MKKRLCTLILVFALVCGVIPFKRIDPLFFLINASAENSTASEATDVELNTEYEDSLQSSKDVNWYRFSLPTDGYVSIDFERAVMNDTTRYWRMTAYKMDESLKEMASWSFDANHAKSSIPEIGLPSGNYYFKIARYSDNPKYYSTGTYTVRANFKASEYWEKEFNSTFETASALNLNTSYQGSLYSTSDVDWYHFTTTVSGYVSIDFERAVMNDTTRYWRMTAYKMDESLKEMASWSFDANHAKSSTPEIGLPSGNYYFKIARYSDNSNYYSTETYTVRANFKASEYWEKEFNSTFDTASTMNLNTSYQGSLYSTSDVDWYHFTTTVNGYVSIDFERDVMNDNDRYWRMTAYKMDESLKEMASWSFDANHAKSSIPEIGLPSGNYYFKIARYSDNSNYYSTETYTVRVNFKVSEYWEKEFNDTFQAATVMNVNKTYNGSLYSSSDADWYEFELKTNSTVELNFITGLIGDSKTYWQLYLYQRTDTIDKINGWNISGASSVSTISNLNLDAGTYYLKVNNYSSNYNSATYQLIVNDGTDYENIMGDVNLDDSFDVTDVMLLQKWLLAVPEITLEKWENADFCADGKLDVFDLCLMKRAIIREGFRSED